MSECVQSYETLAEERSDMVLAMFGGSAVPNRPKSLIDLGFLLACRNELEPVDLLFRPGQRSYNE